MAQENLTPSFDFLKTLEDISDQVSRSNIWKTGQIDAYMEQQEPAVAYLYRMLNLEFERDPKTVEHTKSAIGYPLEITNNQDLLRHMIKIDVSQSLPAMLETEIDKPKSIIDFIQMNWVAKRLLLAVYAGNFGFSSGELIKLSGSVDRAMLVFLTVRIFALQRHYAYCVEMGADALLHISSMVRGLRSKREGLN